MAPADSKAIGRPIPRSPSTSRALSKMYADCRRDAASCYAKTGCGPMTSPPIGVPPRSTTTRAATIPLPICGKLQILRSRSPASSARRRTRFRVAWIQRVYENGSSERDRALDRDPHRRDRARRAMPIACARIRSGSHVNAINWSEGVGAMRTSCLSKAALPMLFLSASTLCRLHHSAKPPPEISYDDAEPARATAPTRRSRLRWSRCQIHYRFPASSSPLHWHASEAGARRSPHTC